MFFREYVWFNRNRRDSQLQLLWELIFPSTMDPHGAEWKDENPGFRTTETFRSKINGLG